MQEEFHSYQYCDELISDEILAKGIKQMLLASKFTPIELNLLPRSVWISLACAIRHVANNGELHGKTADKILRESMIEGILDAEYPDEAKPL